MRVYRRLLQDLRNCVLIKAQLEHQVQHYARRSLRLMTPVLYEANDTLPIRRGKTECKGNDIPRGTVPFQDAIQFSKGPACCRGVPRTQILHKHSNFQVPVKLTPLSTLISLLTASVSPCLR